MHKKTLTLPLKGQECNLAVPPLFINSSHCLSHWVCHATTRYVNVYKSVTAYSLNLSFSVKLRDVFITDYPCTSHQPATFCLSSSITTCSLQRLVHICCIVTHNEGNCQGGKIFLPLPFPISSLQL